MSEVKILLLGQRKETGLELVRMIAGLGYRPAAASWREFHPRAHRRWCGNSGANATPSSP